MAEDPVAEDGDVPSEDGDAARPPVLVDWSVALRVAEWSIARTPAPPAYEREAVQEQFEQLTAQAEGLVGEATGLRSPTGPARARVVGRDAPGCRSTSPRSSAYSARR